MAYVKIILCSFAVFFYECGTALAQQSDRANPRAAKLCRLRTTDTVPPRFSIAALKLAAANILPFSVNYFIRHVDFACISLQSLSDNISLHSWEWDADQFLNNQFSHPYQGSLYFNAFRSEGYRFWQSAPAVLAGSLLWEIAGEKDRPAINDLINTTLGGIAWGEMTHRLAMRLGQNRRNGKTPPALRLLSSIIDPMTAVSSFWSRKGKKPNAHAADTTAIQFELSGGLRQYNRELNYVRQATRGEGYARLNLDYGAPDQPFTTPFSFFSVQAELGTSDSTVFNMARIRGSLAGKNLYHSGQSYHSALLTLNYDYYNNTAFRYGMQSLQFGLQSRFCLLPRIRINTGVGIVGIPLAAVSEDDQYDGHKRNYDYCAGGGIAGSGSITLWDRLRFYTDVRLGWLQTLDGKTSGYRLTNATSYLRAQVLKNISLTYEWGHFFLKSHALQRPVQVKHTWYKRVAVGYQFRL